MAAIYYIDSENVGDSWIELLDDSDSRFIVFYTGHSPRIAYPQAIQLVNAANKPEFIECHEGSNGLDFQLVTYLGYEIHADHSNEMIIVSNDTGFDAAVLFWTDRGMNVRRVPRSNASNSQPSVKIVPVSGDENVTVSPSVKVAEKIGGVDKRELYTIINCIGVENLPYIHAAFVHFYGNKNGVNIYKCLKKEEFAAPPIQWTKDTRMKKFIELIIRYTKTANFSVPDSLPGFIINNIVDDKQSMANKINQAYGGSGPKINKMFKPFYKTLAKIKTK